MKTLIIIAVSIFLTCLILFSVNYFTLFGYYLPHKGQLVDIQVGDISVTSSFGGFITLPNNSGIWENGDVVIANESQNSTN